MTSACLSPVQMQAFLAGKLDPEQEEAVIGHLDGCPRCERLAEALSDDDEARALAATAGHHHHENVGGTELNDLCRRLHALGMYGSVHDGSVHDESVHD